MEPTASYEFYLELPDAMKSISYYVTDDETNEQNLKFQPPVFQTRYDAVKCILGKPEWTPHIKKVHKSNQHLIIPLSIQATSLHFWHHFDQILILYSI